MNIMAEEMKEGYGSYGNTHSSHKKINWSGIDMADNGFIVSWSEMEEKKSGGSLDHCDYVDHKKLFPADEGDAAWDKFKELKMMELERKSKEKAGY